MYQNMTHYQDNRKCLDVDQSFKNYIKTENSSQFSATPKPKKEKIPNNEIGQTGLDMSSYTEKTFDFSEPRKLIISGFKGKWGNHRPTLSN